jgi:hypothetical protein
MYFGVDAGGDVLVAESLNKVFKTMDACRAVKNVDGGGWRSRFWAGSSTIYGLVPSGLGFWILPTYACLVARSVCRGRGGASSRTRRQSALGVFALNDESGKEAACISPQRKHHGIPPGGHLKTEGMHGLRGLGEDSRLLRTLEAWKVRNDPVYSPSRCEAKPHDWKAATGHQELPKSGCFPHSCSCPADQDSRTWMTF